MGPGTRLPTPTVGAQCWPIAAWRSWTSRPPGRRPRVAPLTGDAIVFNGEIYNYLQLRERLAAEGQSFRSTGDTEVMLRALSIRGREAVRWLRGMFTFAFWDH